MDLIARILGRTEQATQNHDCFCVACNCVLPTARIQALHMLQATKPNWQCVPCAKVYLTKKQGIYLGQVGISELKIVKKVYEDSIYEVFNKAKPPPVPPLEEE